MPDVTNPGLVNVSDQGYPGPARNVPGEVTRPAASAAPATNGGDFKPGNGQVREVSRDRIADQVYGSGRPINVYP